MNRRAVLSVSLVALSGCTVSIGEGSDESESEDSEDEPAEETEQDETEQTETEEDIERPVIEEVSLQYDEEWLMLSRWYKTPYYGDEFTTTEQWTIESDDITVEREREQEVEPDSDSEVVWVSESMWFLDRQDNEIQAGDYEVTLVIEAPNGDTSEPVSESISITE